MNVIGEDRNAVYDDGKITANTWFVNVKNLHIRETSSLGRTIFFLANGIRSCRWTGGS